MKSIVRTDLAIEEVDSNDIINNHNDISVDRVVLDEKKAFSLKKKAGTYYTLTTDCFVNLEHDMINDVSKKVCSIIDEFLNNIGFEYRDSVLVMGLGNKDITPDTLGPHVCDNIFISKHLLDLGIDDPNLGNISSISPGVMAQTGMESSEILKSLVDRFKPKLVVVVDALASKSIHRVNQTIQITDAGINPGSGVGNKRKEISKDTLGVPVIAIGVPTVVDVTSITSDTLDYIYENCDDRMKSTMENFISNKESIIKEVLKDSCIDFMVTPKEIDEIIRMLSDCLSLSINNCFHKLEFIN